MAHSSRNVTTFTLSAEQIGRVLKIVTDQMKIVAMKGLYPNLSLSLVKLLNVVRNNIEKIGLKVEEVLLKGSGASFCLAEERETKPRPSYNDIDISFVVKLRNELDQYFIMDEVMSSLQDFFPEGTRQCRISNSLLRDEYLKKPVKIWSQTDRWSLISLGGEHGKDIELKFADHIERDYQFSVDSFGIALDPILSMTDGAVRKSLVQVGPDLLDRVHAICLYGSLSGALYHLNHRRVWTKDPEEIRGGGLLKYCHLRAIGYLPANPKTVGRLELRMSVKFFTDFPLPIVQERTITCYIKTHFPTWRNLPVAFDFLQSLSHRVMRCCAGKHQERTLDLVEQITVNLERASCPLAPPPSPRRTAAAPPTPSTGNSPSRRGNPSPHPLAPPPSPRSTAAAPPTPSTGDSPSRSGNPSAAPPQTPPR